MVLYFTSCSRMVYSYIIYLYFVTVLKFLGICAFGLTLKPFDAYILLFLLSTHHFKKKKKITTFLYIHIFVNNTVTFEHSKSKL